MLAIVIRTNGYHQRIHIPRGNVLGGLYRTIGCNVVTVTATDTFDAWMDDEGLFTAEANPLATMLLTVANGEYRQQYHGDVVLLNRSEEGEALGLSEDQAQGITDLLKLLADDFATFVQSNLTNA